MSTALVILVAGLAAGPSAQAPAVDRPAGAAVAVALPSRNAPGRVFLKLAPGTDVHRAPDGELRTSGGGARDASLEDALRAIGATNATRAWTVPAADRAAATATGLDRWHEITIPAEADPVEVAALLAHASASVEAAEADPEGTIAADAPAPNDPSFEVQWALRNTGQPVNGASGAAGADVDALGAWHLTTGSPATVIAVLDSGVDPHPEFAARLLPGWNVPAGTADTSNQCSSHGTHVAGIAAAAGNDGAGMAGIAWQARILPVTVLSGCSGYASWLSDGIVWAADHGASVINMSLQFSSGPQYMLDAVRYARARGVTLVAAAGNTGSWGVAWPARFAEVVAVGATDALDIPLGYTAIGPEVDVAAPGSAIYSCIAGSAYDYKSGTSMAAPLAAGTIALMRGVAPLVPGPVLESLLASTCTDIGTPGVDSFTGTGRIDAAAAVRAARNAQGLGDLNGDGAIDGTDLGLFLGRWGESGFGCAGDLDDNGATDGGDLGFLLGNWGSAD